MRAGLHHLSGLAGRFGKIRELVQWYSELFLIQSAVFCREEGVDFRSLAADIVILNDRFYKILVAKKKSLD